MKMLLCSIGSRGDIQAFFILGDYLSKQGHEVVVASAKMYAGLAENYDLTYRYFEGDYASIVDDETMKATIGKNPLTITKNLKEKVFRIIENSLDCFYELSQWADKIIYHPKTLIDSFGSSIQEKLIKAYVVPLFTPTSAFANPIVQFLPIPKFLNKYSYRLVHKMMGVVKRPVTNFRAKHQLPKTPLLIDTPILYGISPSFLARPSDYPANHFFTGFWPQKTEGQSLTTEVKNFMAGKEETLVISFGSMPYRARITIHDFIKTILENFRLKILVVKAWGLRDVVIENQDRLLAIERAPFDLLFPLADYVLHHGGAGTTAIALRAGIPQQICPVLHPFGDQYFWGKQIERKAIGPPTIPLKKMTTKNLVHQLTLLQSDAYKKNAKQLAQKIEAEDGLASALEIIERL